MSEASSRESKIYSLLGASSSKDGVETALGRKSGSDFFCDLAEDVCGDKNFFSILHADGAGTKVIPAYLKYRETADLSAFAGIAQDSLVMNIDDLACVNAFDSLQLSNTIGRNRKIIPDPIISQIITGYKNTVSLLAKQGVNISVSGGETADLGDIVRTLVVDSTLFARVKKSKAKDFKSCRSGDLIVGLCSTGQASFEDKKNSGIGSNGLSLARHALIGNSFLKKYPEISDGSVTDFTYQGFEDLFSFNPQLEMSIADAILSPTRPYAGIIKLILTDCFDLISGIVHCTGGGQTKICKFINENCAIKDNLFSCPPIFSLIQKQLNVPWNEMYSTFNMGHRIEIICKKEAIDSIFSIAKTFNIEARIIGSLTNKSDSKLLIKDSLGNNFKYN